MFYWGFPCFLYYIGFLGLTGYLGFTLDFTSFLDFTGLARIVVLTVLELRFRPNLQVLFHPELRLRSEGRIDLCLNTAKINITYQDTPGTIYVLI